MLIHTRKHKFADWRHEEKYCKAELLKTFSCNCGKFRGPILVHPSTIIGRSSTLINLGEIAVPARAYSTGSLNPVPNR